MKEAGRIIYQDNDLLLTETEEGLYLIKGEASYGVTDYPFEPCIYLRAADGSVKTLHNSFSAEELCRAAKEKGSIRMISGNEYDIRGVFRLILKAVGLPGVSFDISYLEGQCLLDYMEERGALSPETAVDLADAGISNPNLMHTFIHAKKAARTENGLFYLRSKRKAL
ncbi:MAG: hypothetical protein IJT43_04165 [Stomatobaculum sp.]|nr:hypothetical protein [Stomatobaculum sp.]